MLYAQIPPAEPIPTLPDETNPGPVPPMGPGEAEPDLEDFPLDPDDPGQSPDLPPGQSPFPDTVEPPTDHPQSL
jgi:hypothetical protein